MSRICPITGRRTRFGKKIARRGLAKSKGGVGIKTTGITPRTFQPNLQWRRLWVPELNRFVRVRLAAHAMKTIHKKGAYRVLLDAGLVKPAKVGKKKAAAKKSA
jgi:large subunit ribosomal protein L28